MKKIISLVLAIALLATASFSVVYAEDWTDETYALSLKVGSITSDDDGNLVTEPLEDGTKLVPGETYTFWLEMASSAELLSSYVTVRYPAEYMEFKDGIVGSGKNRRMAIFNDTWFDWANWNLSTNAPGCNSDDVNSWLFDVNTLIALEASQDVLTWNRSGIFVLTCNVSEALPVGTESGESVVLFAADFTVAADTPADADLSATISAEKQSTNVCYTAKQLASYPKLNNLVATSMTIGGVVATPTPTPTVEPTPTPTVEPTPTPTVEPTPTPTVEPTPTPTVEPTPTPTVEPTPTPTVAPTAAPELINTAVTENALTSADVAAKAFTAFAKINNIAVADVTEFGIKFASGETAVDEAAAKAGTAYVAEGALADGSFSVRLINGEGEVDYFEAAYAGFIPYMVVGGVEYYGTFTTLK